MKVVNKNKVLVMGIIGLIIINSSLLIYQKYTDKKTNIPKVKLKNQEKKRDTFAIMLEQDDGTYQATDSTTFNQPGYTFNNMKSGCIDTNGNKIENALSYNETTKNVIVNVESTAYCYVYFDKVPTDPNEIITTLASVDEIAYDGTTDNNLRYIGADPNNYIYFNCSDYNNPTADTCEKWRIIGAFNNMKTSTGETKTLFKIIRGEKLGNYYWDKKYSGVGTSISSRGSNYWPDSQLMLMLNGVSLGNYKSGYTVSGNYLRDTRGNNIMNISGSYYAGSSVTYKPARTETGGFTSTDTVDFSNIGLKNDTTRDIIENVVWKLGSVTCSDGSSCNLLASQFYSYERNSSVDMEWTGKIGLMYASDYGYATSGGTSTNRATCLATGLYKWPSYSECFNNNWLYNGFGSIDEHLLNKNADTSYGVFFINRMGSVNDVVSNGKGGLNDGSTDATFIVRPSVYLTSNIGISGGEGSSSSPYIIKINAS